MLGENGRTWFQKLNIFYYIREIKKYCAYNKIKNMLTPVPSKSYIQIYQLPEAVNISRDRKLSTLSSIVKNFSEIDTELANSIHEAKFKGHGSDFYPHKFGIIFDMRKTRMASPVVKELLKDIAGIIDLFPRIQLTMVFPNLKNMKKRDEIHYEEMKDLKDSIKFNVEHKGIIGAMIIEAGHIKQEMYYDFLKR